MIITSLSLPPFLPQQPTSPLALLHSPIFSIATPQTLTLNRHSTTSVPSADPVMDFDHSGGGSVSPRLVKLVLAAMALGIAVYILGPPLYWHLAEALAGASSDSVAVSGCPVCSCDCSSQPLLSMPEELTNISALDCAKRDPDVNEEMEKSFTDLLAEELKLREAESMEGQQRADITLLEAKKMASQYQKEADKCNSGMETCEEARERAEAALVEQRRQSMMWEKRARQRGWKDGGKAQG